MKPLVALFATLSLGVTAADAATLAGRELVTALRHGGYVILMRHASSPRTPPEGAKADPENLQHERQLDEVGRDSARAMGSALHRLRIPIGQVLSSPTYRALETVRLAQLGRPWTSDELGDGGQSMRPDANSTRGAWLRAKVAEPPKPGTDTVIVTHYPNISEAFPGAAKDLADGEALIFRPRGHSGSELVARVRIEEWSRLANLP